MQPKRSQASSSGCRSGGSGCGAVAGMVVGCTRVMGSAMTVRTMVGARVPPPGTTLSCMSEECHQWLFYDPLQWESLPNGLFYDPLQWESLPKGTRYDEITSETPKPRKSSKSDQFSWFYRFFIKIIKKWSIFVKNVKKGQKVAPIKRDSDTSKQGKTLTLLNAANSHFFCFDKTDISHCF